MLKYAITVVIADSLKGGTATKNINVALRIHLYTESVDVPKPTVFLFTEVVINCNKYHPPYILLCFIYFQGRSKCWD